MSQKDESAREYLNKHNLHLLFEHLTYQLLTDRPDDPLRYIFDKVGNKIGVDTTKIQSYPAKKSLYQIIFVLGGPGCGKGTQCLRLVKEGLAISISSGDLLRNEVEKGTPQGKSLKDIMEKGDLVPKEVVISLLKKWIFSQKQNSVILLDGFPREMGQALTFESNIEPCSLVLFYSCPDEVLSKRLLGRGRSDDNETTVKNRLKVFHNETQPVMEYYQRLNKLAIVDANRNQDEIYSDVKRVIQQFSADK